MKMPGFSAEMALETNALYTMFGVPTSVENAGVVIPQFCVSSPCFTVNGVGSRKVQCCLDFWPPNASCNLISC
jgi:hypothetical protein